MANPLTEFTKNNITELVLGLAIGVIIVLLMDLNFQESMFIIILGPLVAIILNQLLKVVVPNTKNQRTALIILTLIGGFVLMQQFNIGIFSLDNVNSQSFVEAPDEPQFAITGALLTGIGGIIGGVAKLPFLIILALIIGFLLIAFPPIGIAVLLIVGIPILFTLGTGVFLIASNFTLILILVGGYAILSLIFRKPIEKQSQKK